MKAVRRNITLNKFAAAHLEEASNFTGRSQSEILETALNQPIMRRLWAFTDPSVDNPIVELLETYQTNEEHMTPRIGEVILQAVEKWVEYSAAVKDKAHLGIKLRDTNSYIAGHMTKGSMEAYPYFASVQKEAALGTFLTPEMEPEKIREKVLEFIKAIMTGPTDKHRMGESYLFRDLLIMLADYFEPPTKDELQRMYKELSDGCVLPYHEI